MKLVSGILLLVYVVAVSAEELNSSEIPTAFGYHKRFGIPKAAEIKKWEKENVAKDMERIIGGWHVDVTQVPYQAGLVIQINWFWQSVCGASLISHNRLITAAHCNDDGQYVANSFTVVLGSNFIFSGGLRVVTRDAVMHPSWNPNTLDSDIAVLRTSSISFTNSIQPISLPTSSDASIDFTGWTGTASGFGFTRDGGNIPNDQRLSAVNLSVMSPTDCSRFYGHWYRNTNICTSGAGIRGTCHGDSGGPLAITVNNRRIVVGVTSYGSWRGCQAGDPSVFARVSSFRNWIASVYEHTGAFDYHRKFGIPAAARILHEENNIKSAERVAGGSSTTSLSVPHQVGLVISINIFSTSVCGATLISDSRVLTAAHCYNDGNNIAQSFTVVLGSNLLFSGGTRITTSDFVVYPGYNPRIIVNDLGIIRITRVTFSLTIQPINLPSGSELNLDYVGYTALASGYGITRDGDSIGVLQTLSSVNLRVITNNECSNSYSGIVDTHLCTSGAGGVGACSGDTGGPLTTTVNGRRILIGISSFVSTRGCQAGHPSGFTRVTAYTNWIHSI